MANPTYMISKNGRYYFKRRVPKGLVEKVGKPFWEISLGTGDRRQAEKLARAQAVATDDLIADLARHSPEEILANQPKMLSPDQHALIKSAGGLEKLSQSLDMDLSQIAYLAAAHDMLFSPKATSEWMEEVDVTPPELEYHETEGELSLRQIELVKQRIAKKHQVQVKLGIDAQRSEAIADELAPCLSALLERWKTETDPADTSYESFRYSVRRFEELHGRIPVTEIDV